MIWIQRILLQLDVVVHTCDTNTWEAEAGISRVQIKSWQYSEFKVSLDMMAKTVDNGYETQEERTPTKGSHNTKGDRHK